MVLEIPTQWTDDRAI